MIAAPAWFEPLVRAATASDGQPPFSDQALVDLAAGTRTLTAIEGVAAAVHSSAELEFVVAPSARRRGHGKALAEKVLGENPNVRLAW
ncbi:MAG TPA: mycothiol synthase, partial [Terrimesophilobacter sp.]|nr:mycothiol synthase [Terrimesophilobacter sp.]